MKSLERKFYEFMKKELKSKSKKELINLLIGACILQHPNKLNFTGG